MPLYKLSIHKNCFRRERLGGTGFTDDAEALAFGKRVIRDLIDRDVGQYATGPSILRTQIAERWSFPLKLSNSVNRPGLRANRTNDQIDVSVKDGKADQWTKI
jgi:hypothetical protein